MRTHLGFAVVEVTEMISMHVNNRRLNAKMQEALEALYAVYSFLVIVISAYPLCHC